MLPSRRPPPPPGPAGASSSPLVAVVVKGTLAGGGGLIVVVRGVPAVVEYPLLRSRAARAGYVYIGKAVTLCGTEWHLPKLNTPAILYTLQITDYRYLYREVYKLTSSVAS
eukprot:scaffold79497_cov63-Phaeocystis_antarctica.AAC.1